MLIKLKNCDIMYASSNDIEHVRAEYYASCDGFKYHLRTKSGFEVEIPEATYKTISNKFLLND